MATKYVNKPVSTKGSINWRDFLKSLAVAGGAAAVIVLQQGLNTGHFPDTEGWKAVGLAGFAGCVGYIGKQFLSGPKDDLL